jgi:uncharacterized membrane protein YkoI
MADYASKVTENDAIAIAGAKIGLGQAVAAAERHVGGKASRAEYERHNGQWVFDIEVVKGESVMDVKIDAANGRVVEANVDKADKDDAGDRAD